MSSFESDRRLFLSGFRATSKSGRARRNWMRWWRYYYKRFLRLRGTPESIARGFAAGVFTGMFPIFGLQIVAGVALATLLRGNKILAAAATWISNPVTNLPICILNFQVGRWVLGSDRAFNPQNITSADRLLEFGTEFAIELLVGSCAVAAVCAVGSYFLALRAIRRARKRRKFLRSQKLANPN
ncbi:MAG: DUF2062 domain-containing protein [Microcoleus sp.]